MSCDVSLAGGVGAIAGLAMLLVWPWMHRAPIVAGTTLGFLVVGGTVVLVGLACS